MENANIIILLLVLWFNNSEAARRCEFQAKYRASDIYVQGGNEWTYWYKNEGFTDFTLGIDVPEGGRVYNWVDVSWNVGDVRGRVSAFGDLVVSRRDLSVIQGGALNVSLIFGSGDLVDVDLKVSLVGPNDLGPCVNGSTMGPAQHDYSSVTGNRTKRDVIMPRYVGLHEVQSADYAFIWPIVSKYDVKTLALAAGADIEASHEYVQLSQYERQVYALLVPGISVSGPSYPHESTISSYYQGRQLFKYSKRDAAWVLWDYKTKKPLWSADHEGADYWKYRSCAVPIQQPGLIFDHTETQH